MVAMNPAPLEPGETSRIFDLASSSIMGGIARGASLVTHAVHGNDEATPDGDRDGFMDGLPGSVSRLERALRLLHREGGLFVCVSSGAVRGACLELALLADIHLMSADARIYPAGLLDEHIPCAGGWSRLIERVGPARAGALLLSPRAASGVTAEEALRWSLCDGIGGEEIVDSILARTRSHAPVARRLALELSERHRRSGGLTPRQARLLERASFALAFSSEEPASRIAAFFDDRHRGGGRES